MIKNKSELSDHIYTLIKSGELSFVTYSDWLYWGGHSNIYERLAEENYELNLNETIDAKNYLNYLQERLLFVSYRLYTSSLHSANELELMELKTLGKFLKEHVKYNA